MPERVDADEAGARGLLEQSIGNAIAMHTVIRVFLEGKGIDPAELDDFYAPGWADARKPRDDRALRRAEHAHLRVRHRDRERGRHRNRHGDVVTGHDDPDWSIPMRPALAKSPRTYEPIMRWLGVGYMWDATDEGIVLHLAERPG